MQMEIESSVKNTTNVKPINLITTNDALKNYSMPFQNHFFKIQTNLMIILTFFISNCI